MSNTAELSPEVIAEAQKVLARKEKELEKRKKNIRTKYPFADAETLSYDAVAKKWEVVVTCECGEEHSRYTSDLAQTKGVCPDCKKAKDKEARAAKQTLVKQAMQAIADGKISL